MPNQIVFGAILTPTAPLPAMEVSINSGATFMPVTFVTVGSSQQYTLTGVPAATYAAGSLILGAVGYPATRLSNTTGIIVTATAATPSVVLTPALADFSFNVRTDTSLTTHSALSSLFVNVAGAAYVDVEYTNSRAIPAATASGQPDPYGVSVNSLGAFDSVFQASGIGIGLVTRMTFTNAAAGIRQFVEGVQERNLGDTGTFGETHITKLTFPPGSTATFQKPTANTDRALILGDSKSVGVYASNPGSTAWLSVLRGKRPAIDFYSDGWGYRRASVALVDAPTRAVLVTNAVRLGITRYVVALGTNDRGAGLDPATVMSLVSAMADELRTQIPAIIFYVELEYNNGTTANTAWRGAATNSKGARGAWYRFIDPGAPITADGTHPTDAGQLTVANAYDAQLDAAPAATGFLEDSLLTYAGATWSTAGNQGGTHDGFVHYTNIPNATATGTGSGQGVNWYGTGGQSSPANGTFTVVNAATGATVYTATVDLSIKTAAMQILAGVTGLPFAQYKAQITCGTNYINVDGFDFV